MLSGAGRTAPAFVTLLRDPVDCFESNFIFMRPGWKAGDLDAFVSSGRAAPDDVRPRNAYIGRNQLLWDLGMDGEDTLDRDKVEEFVAAAEEEFDLVLIAEEFEESVVLMQDMLCWPDEDVR